MIVTLLVLISLAAVAVLAYGLTSAKEAWDLEEGDGLLTRLKKQKDRLLRALKDIEEAHATGTLVEEEFRELRNDYRLRVVAAMKELDRVRATRVRRVATGARGLSPSQRRRVENLVTERKEKEAR